MTSHTQILNTTQCDTTFVTPQQPEAALINKKISVPQFISHSPSTGFMLAKIAYYTYSSLQTAENKYTSTTPIFNYHFLVPSRYNALQVVLVHLSFNTTPLIHASSPYLSCSVLQSRFEARYPTDARMEATSCLLGGVTFPICNQCWFVTMWGV